MAPPAPPPPEESPSEEYPLALEYHGPPISFRIPKVMPIDANLILLTPPSPPTPNKVTRWSSKITYDRGEPSEIPEAVEDPSPSVPPLPEHSSPMPWSPASDYRASPARVPGGAEERRRGSCHMCGKGSRYTEKERCIACGAKYCGGCVLRAMGSMPEGRKCLGCVGRPIEEARRGELGRSPRVLRRVLTWREVDQVMRAEKESEANRLRPETVFVNGEPLGEEEMAILESCEIPPGKLRPGRYWYDKMSGLWGLEGHKPHKIITHNLNIRGGLQEMASNGDTGILINGRNIKKSERYLLKFAGVEHAGNPHFWLYANGDYQEEGQRNIQGNLWRKCGTRLLCHSLSLPFPSKVTETTNESNGTMHCALPAPVHKEQMQGILLVGSHESGANTIFKQAKFLYKHGSFTKEEREGIKVTIQCNTYKYLGILLEGREQFEEECLRGKPDDERQLNAYSITPRLKEFSDWFLGVIYSGNLEVFFPASNREYFPLVKKLWNSNAIQATYKRRHELQNLPSIASYFLEKAVDILAEEYEVSDRDILHTDLVVTTNGIAHTELSLPPGNDGDSHEPRLISNGHEAIGRYDLIMVHTNILNGNNKWLDMFEDARLVIFCVALTDYNEYYEDNNGNFMNKMLANKMLLERIASYPSFSRKNFLLVLNKFDLLEQTIAHAPLTLCDWFSSFNAVQSHRNEKSTSAEQAFHYIASKFKTVFAALTGRRLYVIQTNGLDSKSVDRMFRHSREILMWEEEKLLFGTYEVSTYSTDPSSFISQ